MKQLIFLLFVFYCPLLVFSQSHQVSLLFAGDAMQHKSQIDAAKKGDGNHDYSEYFKEIEAEIKSCDLSVVNLEVTLGGIPYSGYPMFSAPDEYAMSLKDAGFKILLTANNHSADKRRIGIERTIEVLDSLNILHTGTFKDSVERLTYYPLMLIEHGIRIAMLNYTYGTNGMPVHSPNIVNLIDTTQMKQDIADAKRLGAEIIIANMHWGDEYVLKQNKRQECIANFLIRNGVRIVVGNHPHVVQPVDIRRAKDNSIEAIIIYSLGNFISGMKKIDTRGGMLAKITISKEDGETVVIDNFDYSLLWTHRFKTEEKDVNFKLLNVDEYKNEKGVAILGNDYGKMEIFAKNAQKAIESLWNKEP